MSIKQQTGVCAMRMARLNSAGLPYASATGGWTVCDPVNVGMTFEYDTGTDVVKKDGCGRACFVRKRPNNLKNGTLKYEVCGGDPNMMELFLGGTGVVVGGGTPTGFGLQNAACNAPARNGIFVEWWTENYLCNTTDPVNQWTRHFAPRAIVDWDGGTWDEGAFALTFTGVANAGVINPSSGTTAGGGPFNDITGFASNQGFLYGFQIETTDVVASLQANCGAFTTVPTP